MMCHESKTSTFSRVFHPKKSTIFSGNQSWIFGQKMKISNSVDWFLFRLKPKVESFGSSVQFHLTSWKDTQPRGGCGSSGTGCGCGCTTLSSEDSGQVTGQVSGQQFGTLVSGIMRIDEWWIRFGFIVIFVIVFFRFFTFNSNIRGWGLTSGGNVIAVQDAEAVDSGRVADGVGFAVVSNVRILSDTFVISSMKNKNTNQVFCLVFNKWRKKS